MTFRIPPEDNPQIPEFGYWQVTVTNPKTGAAKTFDNFRLTKCRLVSKLSQVPIFDCQVPKTTDADYAALLREGYDLAVYYDGLFLFDGQIRKARYNDTTEVTTLQADGAIQSWKDASCANPVTFKGVAVHQVLRWMMEQVNSQSSRTWTFSWADPDLNAQDGPEDFVSYTFGPGNFLEHFLNVMALTGFDWHVQPKGNRQYRIRLFPRTMAPSAWADKIKVDGDQGMKIKESVTDLDRIKTKVTITGGSDETSESKTTFVAAQRNLAYCASNESYLTANLEKDNTDRFYVADNSGYDKRGGQVLLEKERIWYGEPGIEPTVGVGGESQKRFYVKIKRRGYAGTTIAAHPINTPAPICDDIDLFVDPDNVADDLDFLPATNGVVWIGQEQVKYRCLKILPESAWVGFKWERYKLQDVTRGYNGTKIYSHTRGIAIVPVGVTEDHPETDSPIDRHGIHSETQAARGVGDQDSVDRFAQALCLVQSTLRPWGTSTLSSAGMHPLLIPGNWFEITKVDRDDLTKTTIYTPIVGITVDQATNKITVDFGDTEEYVMARLRGIEKALSLAGEKNRKARVGTIVPGSIAADGRVAQVNVGTEENPVLQWVEI